MDSKKTGLTIRLARIKAGFSQNELAERLNVKQSSVSLWERGRNLPKAQNMVRLSELLDIPVDELLKVG